MMKKSDEVKQVWRLTYESTYGIVKEAVFAAADPDEAAGELTRERSDVARIVSIRIDPSPFG